MNRVVYKTYTQRRDKLLRKNRVKKLRQKVNQINLFEPFWYKQLTDWEVFMCDKLYDTCILTPDEIQDILDLDDDEVEENGYNFEDFDTLPEPPYDVLDEEEVVVLD